MSTKQLNPTEFASSIRGQLIISQALTFAMHYMKVVPSPFTEVSNISDMEYIKENVFPLYQSDYSEVLEDITDALDKMGKPLYSASMSKKSVDSTEHKIPYMQRGHELETLDTYLDAMLEKGKITKEQYDAMHIIDSRLTVRENLAIAEAEAEGDE